MPAEPTHAEPAPAVAGAFELLAVSHRPAAGGRGGTLRVTLRCGGEPLRVDLPPEAFESFVRFRSEVFARTGRWLTVADPFAVTWQEIVAAACESKAPAGGTADAASADP